MLLQTRWFHAFPEVFFRAPKFHGVWGGFHGVWGGFHAVFTLVSRWCVLLLFQRKLQVLYRNTTEPGTGLRVLPAGQEKPEDVGDVWGPRHFMHLGSKQLT